MSEPRPHHRPVPKRGAFFEEQTGGPDPALVAEAAERAAAALVDGVRSRSGDDAALVERLVHLADTEGIEAIAEAWAHSPADSLGGCLWRLYLLRSWVYADPHGVARQFEAGRRSAEFARVVAGVADPPGPDELRAMVDAVLRGIAGGDFADVLLRAAAFARVIAAGRASLPEVAHADVRRVLVLAEQLEAAGHVRLRDEPAAT